MPQPVFTEAIVATAGHPRADGTVLSGDALRALHDGVHYFWDEPRGQLFYRGPLPQPEAAPTKPLAPAGRIRRENTRPAWPATGCTCHTGIRPQNCPVCGG